MTAVIEDELERGRLVYFIFVAVIICEFFVIYVLPNYAGRSVPYSPPAHLVSLFHAPPQQKQVRRASVPVAEVEPEPSVGKDSPSVIAPWEAKAFLPFYNVTVDATPITDMEIDIPSFVKRAGIQGTVILDIYVDRTGVVVKVIIYKSSGHEILDKLAQEAAGRMRFTPAKDSSGKEVGVFVRWPERFVLEN